MKASYLLTGLAALLLSACASLSSPGSAPATVASATRSSVVFLSIDGLNASALGKGHTPNLDRLAAAGSRRAG